jgi:hypothetical protein
MRRNTCGCSTTLVVFARKRTSCHFVSEDKESRPGVDEQLAFASSCSNSYVRASASVNTMPTAPGQWRKTCNGITL